MRNESRPGKRTLRVLPVAVKLEAIQRVLDGESKVSVARSIGVPESTLRGWCKSEHKIRSMARNSSTPESDAYSPASSSGANALRAINSSNLSSEDEDMAAAGVPAKRIKLEDGLSAEEQDTNKQSEADYVGLINSLRHSGVRSDSSSMLLQQLGLFNFGKGLNCHSSPHSSSSSQTVSFGGNGSQYTKCGSKRSSTGSHLSAIAPTTSPGNHTEPLNLSSNSRSLKTNSSSNTDRGESDESLWMWTAQQQLLGQRQTHFNWSEWSWFWQLYMSYYSQPIMTSTLPTPLTAQDTHATKSPSKANSLLDNELCNDIKSSNNNEHSNEEAEQPSAGEEPQQNSAEEQIPQQLEQALEHGEKFLKCLESCSDPSVTQLQIMQFKYLLDNLKASNKKTPTCEQNGK